MARTKARQLTFNKVLASEEEENSSEAAAVPEVLSDDETVEHWLDGLSPQDQFHVERLTPLEHRGYLICFPFEPSMNLEEEIKRSFGGGSYLVKIRKHGRNGAFSWKKGSVRIVISGEPKVARQVLPTYPVAQPFPAQQPALDGLQSKLLEIVQSQLGASSHPDVTGLVGQVFDVVKQSMSTLTPPQSIGGVDEILKQAQAFKRLKELFADENPRENPAPAPSVSPVEQMMMMMAMQFMQGRQAPPQAVQPRYAPQAAPSTNPGPRVAKVANAPQKGPVREGESRPGSEPENAPYRYNPDASPYRYNPDNPENPFADLGDPEGVDGEGAPLSAEELAEEVHALDPQERLEFFSKLVPGVDPALLEQFLAEQQKGDAI